MLPKTTDFIDNAIGIDPSGCGCTDCLVRNSIPLDHTSDIEELVRAHFMTGRKIVNRSSSTLAIYVNASAEVAVEALECTGPVIDALAPDMHSEAVYAFYMTDEDADEDEQAKVVALDSYALDIDEAIEDYYQNNATLVNRTESTLVLYRNYMGRYVAHKIEDAFNRLEILPD